MIRCLFLFILGLSINFIFCDFRDLDQLYLSLAKEYNFGQYNDGVKKEKLNNLDVFINNILKFSNVEFSDVLDSDCYDDIRLFYGGVNKPSVSFLNSINDSNSDLLKFFFAYKLANPTINIQKLLLIQNIVKYLNENSEVREELSKIFSEFKKIEASIIDFFDVRSSFFKMDKLRFKNKFYYDNRSNSNKDISAIFFKKIFSDLYNIVLKPYYSGVGIAFYLSAYFIMFDSITSNLFLKLSQFVPVPFFKEIVTLFHICPIISALMKSRSLVAGGLFIGGVVTSVCSFIRMFRKFRCYRNDYKVIYSRVRDLQTFVVLLDRILKVLDNNSVLKTYLLDLLGPIDRLFNCDRYEFKFTIIYMLKKNIGGCYFSYKAPFVLVMFNVLNDNRSLFIDPLCRFLELWSYIVVAKKVSSCKDFSFAKFNIHSRRPYIRIKDLWTPLIPGKNIVKNDLIIGEGYNHMLMCGHNGGGKSTYLNGVLLNLIFIQSFGVSMSSESELTVFRKILLFQNILDDINNGDSLYRAEIKRLKYYLDLCKDCCGTDKFIFSVFDEPLIGTDSKSAVSILSGILKYLSSINRNVLNIVSSHYNKLSDMCNSRDFRNFYFDSVLDDRGSLKYLYKLVEGRANNSLAIPIAKDVGVDQDVLKRIKNVYNSCVW